MPDLILKIAAKVDKVDEPYFDQIVRPLLDDPQIEFVGEINDNQKQAFWVAQKAFCYFRSISLSHSASS